MILHKRGWARCSPFLVIVLSSLWFQFLCLKEFTVDNFPHITATQHVETPPVDAATLSPKVFELSDDPSKESILGTWNGTVLSLKVLSFRPECAQGDCVYRCYIEGELRHGKYFHSAKHDAVYEAGGFNLAESGRYQLLVLLELLRNASLPAQTFSDFMVEKPKNNSMQHFGTRVSHSNASVQRTATTRALDPTVYRQTMPQCVYTADTDIQKQFEWIHRERLKAYGFSANETLMIPDDQLDPTGDLTRFTSQLAQKHLLWQNDNATSEADGHPEWIQPFQDYVYFGQTCQQRFISPHDVYRVAAKQPGGISLIMIGTSRYRDMLGVLRTFLRRPDIAASQNLHEMVNIYMRRKMNKKQFKSTLNDFFNDLQLCVPEKNSTDQPTLVFAFSDGMHAASFQEPRQDAPFEFDKGHVGVSWIQRRCQGFRFKIILLTEFSTHPFDGTVDAYATKEYTPNFLVAHGVLGSRLEVASWEFRQAAETFNLPFVDVFGATLARRDSCLDNVHQRVTGRSRSLMIGNEVSFTAGQLLLAAMFQAFEENL